MDRWRTPVRPEELDQPSGQRSRAATNVQDVLTSSDAGEDGELFRQGLGEPTHEPVVVLCGDGERHVATIRLRSLGQ